MDFVTNLAASLAYDLFKIVASRLRDAAFSDEEQRALGRVYQPAFAAMLRHVASQVSQEMSPHLESLLRSFQYQMSSETGSSEQPTRGRARR